MEDKNLLKVFISYSHTDEDHINNFIKHISPMKTQGLIENWYDRKIFAGDDFINTIENNLENADVVCLFVSASFLASSACMREKDTAFSLKKKKGISVITIILSACAWQDFDDLSNSLALPTDGKSISSYPDHNEGWKVVYDGLKRVVLKDLEMRTIRICDSFQAFLQDADILTKAHSQKTNVLIDDIFIYPDLRKINFTDDNDKKISSERLIDELFEVNRILLIGENQSGKTTLCKILFLQLREKNLIPIYLFDESSHYRGNIKQRIEKAYKEQYSIVPYENINQLKIVPIVDDFHFAVNQETILSDLNSYNYQLLIVDEIFNLNIKSDQTVKNYFQYKIRSLSPILRNELIKKWILLDENFGKPSRENELYKSLDDATELVDGTLGKLFNSGIMPSYPFFVLSVLSTYNTYDKPLNEEITSQGYCYQALIYMYLRKEGVKNEDIDTYINFLSVIAFCFFKDKRSEMTVTDFDSFMEKYVDEYNLPINRRELLSKLDSTRILSKNSCGNFYFNYLYLYYFFVAKYLSEHLCENQNNISEIIGNLQKDENAYIAIFIAHHTKNNYVLDEIVLNALCLFDKYPSATLSKDELSFFDDELNSIIDAVLPDDNASPESERQKRLQQQERLEEKNEIQDADKENELPDNDFSIELRRSIKTVEVMGRIVKNRAGSLDKNRIEEIITEGMNIILRLLSSFFVIIKNKEYQDVIIDFISVRMQIYIDKQKRMPDSEKLEIHAKELFWNLNFGVICGHINIIIHSLGSDKLQKIINITCDKIQTPAALLVKHGTLMWYCKNLQIDNIVKEFADKDFSETAKKVMRHLIVNHSSMHRIDFKDKQKIESKLNISSKKLLSINYLGSLDKKNQ